MKTVSYNNETWQILGETENNYLIGKETFKNHQAKMYDTQSVNKSDVSNLIETNQIHTGACII